MKVHQRKNTRWNGIVRWYKKVLVQLRYNLKIVEMKMHKHLILPYAP